MLIKHIEKVYFKYCLRSEKSFSFSLFAFLARKTPKVVLAFHVTPFPFSTFFLQPEVKLNRNYFVGKFFDGKSMSWKVDFKITKKNIWNFHLHFFMKFNDLPDRNTKKNYFLFLTLFRAAKNEKLKILKRSENKNLHSSFSFLITAKEWSFCSMHISGAEYALYDDFYGFWHIMSIVKIMKWKVLKKSEWNFADTIMS